jgi:single-strand DNA-binding protein
MNLCVFTGRTTKDIELRYTQNKMAIGKFSLAVDSFGENKKTSFFDMTVFGTTAENMEKLARKGQKLLVQCEAQQNEWQDREGNKRTSIGFVVKNFELCSRKSDTEQSDPTPKADADGFFSIPDGIDEELPWS